ncbi:hypothetical protein ACTHPF_26315, partial [Paenibacillus sp. SAF-054]|uniref:hypothetical protein n=1 Tax=unclassified Paenibacillus TaxID=185978 RepID=UPI003F80F20B
LSIQASFEALFRSPPHLSGDFYNISYMLGVLQVFFLKTFFEAFKIFNLAVPRRLAILCD